MMPVSSTGTDHSGARRTRVGTGRSDLRRHIHCTQPLDLGLLPGILPHARVASRMPATPVQPPCSPEGPGNRDRAEPPVGWLPGATISESAPRTHQCRARSAAASGAAASGAAAHPPHVLLVVLIGVRVALHVEVLELFEVTALRDEGLQRRRVLPRAVPRAGRIAYLVGGVSNPLLGLERHLAHLEDTDLAILGCVHMLEVGLVDTDAHLAGHAHLIEKGLGHHRRRRAVLQESELRARRVGAVARVDGVADTRQVGRLGQVVPAATRPHEHIVGEVAGHAVRLLLGG
mmetsp:Transcript_39195/g.103270  ORF Transcript_39195/g.103270 Transcript_39195/m.103270 type:complete len:289 (-) Transcript_39195:1994-2860(-)